MDSRPVLTRRNDRRLRLSTKRTIEDLSPGDCVRWKYHRGVGFVESLTDNGHAWVAWKNGHKTLLPLVILRRVRPGGHAFDSRFKMTSQEQGS